MKKKIEIKSDYYVVSDDYRLIDFNECVAERYEGIKRGDLCYRATMRRDTPCQHCPIAGNSDDTCPVYYDPFYHDWMEANFSDLGGGKYAEICHPVDINDRSIFHMLKSADISDTTGLFDDTESDRVGVIGGYCEEGFPFYYVSDNMVKMLGYENKDELKLNIDGKVLNTIHPDDLPRVQFDMGNNYYAGMHYETTYRMRRKDGTYFWVVDRGEIIEIKGGKLICICVCLNVDKEFQQRESERNELLANAAKGQILSDITKSLYGYNMSVNLQDGTYTIIEGNGMEKVVEFLKAHRSYEEIYDEFIQNTDESQRVRAAELLSLDAYKGKTDKIGLIATEEFLKHYPDGTSGWCEINIFVGFDNNGKQSLNILGRDVTDAHERANTKAQLEIAEAANIAKTVFLSSMSHDIRTPMNAIFGMTELMTQDADISENQKEYIKKIKQSSQYLLDLVNEVLDISKIEACEVQLASEPVSLSEEIAQIESIIRPRAAEKGQDFIIRIHGITNEFHIGDSVRLRQVAINLLSNSVKYTPFGGTIQLDVAELPRDDPDYSIIQLKVRDNGYGMTKEYQEHIFEAFSRAESSLTNSVQGTGLGMTITKTIVDLLGGEIKIDSEIGKGTCVTVEFPLPIDHNASQSGSAGNVLFVSKDEMFVGNVKAMASVGNTKVFFAENIDAAQESVKAQRFDIVVLEGMITDENLPAYVSRLRSAANYEVLIFCTDYVVGQSEARVRSGANGLIPRPFFLSQINNIVEQMQNEYIDDENYSKSVLFKKRFLCAEDNELNAEILSAILENYQATCDIYPNGEEVVKAFERCKPGDYDAVLMDIQMPIMNGLDATKAIRNGKNPFGKTIPIIAMTANAFSEDVQNCLNAGINAHISKPIDVGSLERVIRRGFAPTPKAVLS